MDIEPSNNNGRTPGGTFAPGNRFGKGGNNTLRRMHELRATLVNAATPETLARLAEKLAAQALEGDTAAARLYLEYTLGKPAQAIELSGPDGTPMGIDLPRLQAALSAALEPFGENVKFAAALAIRSVGREPD